MSDDERVKTLQRIDTNVKWIMRLGGALCAVILMFGGWLFNQEYEQMGIISQAEASIQSVEKRVEKVENYIERVTENK